jgi:predicted TPR repeat methyltransferase
MIDLVKETPIDVSGVAERYNVAEVTVYGWFRRGLAHAKAGGTGKAVTTLEALQRFFVQVGGTDDVSRRQESGRTEADAAMKRLERRGLKAR